MAVPHGQHEPAVEAAQPCSNTQTHVCLEQNALEPRHDRVAATVAFADSGNRATSRKLGGTPAKMLGRNAFAELGGANERILLLKS